MWRNVKIRTWLWGALLSVVGLLALSFIGYKLWRLRRAPFVQTQRPPVPFAQAPTVRPVEKPAGVAPKVEPEQLPALAADQPAPSASAERPLPAIPIQVAEVASGRVWKIRLAGSADARTAVAHVRAASPATILLQGGRTYRFVSPGIPAGRIHVTTQYVGAPSTPVKDALVHGDDLPYGLTKICPRYEMRTCVWQEGSANPLEIVVEDADEPHQTAYANAARVVDSRTVP